MWSFHRRGFMVSSVRSVVKFAKYVQLKNILVLLSEFNAIDKSHFFIEKLPLIP